MQGLVPSLVLVATTLSVRAGTRPARFVEMREHSTIDYRIVSGDTSKRLVLTFVAARAQEAAGTEIEIHEEGDELSIHKLEPLPLSGSTRREP